MDTRSAHSLNHAVINAVKQMGFDPDSANGLLTSYAYLLRDVADELAELQAGANDGQLDHVMAALDHLARDLAYVGTHWTTT